MKRKEEHMYQICPGDDEEAWKTNVSPYWI
jgi:hypothetical protein